MSEVAAIRTLLENDEPESRRLGTKQLSALSGHEATAMLLQALGDEDWRVRKEASLVAASLEHREEVVLALVAALDEKENIGLRNAAVEALVGIGADAVPAAIGALASLDADGRKLAVEILAGVPDAQGMYAVAAALADPDPNIRCTAAEALGGAGAAGEEVRARAVEALAAVLSSDEKFVKLAALGALARLEAKLSWSIFEPLTKDPMLRRHAIAAAARSPDRDAVLALVAATADRSSAVSREALIALVECVVLEGNAELVEVAGIAMRGSPMARERVRQEATSTNARVRGAALVALGLARDRADVPLLVEALADEEVASRAETGLRLFGKDAVASLLEAGFQSKQPVRATTIALVPILSRTSDTPTLRALYEALEDPRSDVVAAAIKVISLTGGKGDMARLVRFATNPDPTVAATACAALQALAPRHASDARALCATIDATTDADAIVGCVVLGSLAGPDRSAAVQEADVRFLRAAIANVDARTRRAAVDALAAMGGDVAAEAVTLAIADEESSVSLAAIRALGHMGRAETLANLLASSRDPSLSSAALRALADANPTRAFEVARPFLRSPDPMLAFAAVEAIGAVRGLRREDGLFEALEHREPEVVKAALFELSRSLDARSLARLGLCLDHESWEVRRLAAELLGREGSGSARALLRARLEREKDDPVREALATALAARPTGGEVG